MRKVALALTLARWGELILSSREKAAATKAKAPDLGALLDELEQRLERTRGLDVERLRLKAEQQRVTQEIRQMRTEGDDLAMRICSLLKSVFGIQSEALRQFGMRPKPRRYRRRSTSRPREEGNGSA
ncbi:MAG: hypothetical protein QOH06_2429 [Acidobacteriota bacterium]|jgi:chromosome segregation ATPase|nr:hypothetical protein [Acidobacteriota bacterium]